MDDYLKGKKLIGDNYTQKQIEQWYVDEKEAYADLNDSDNSNSEKSYSYHKLNVKYGYKHLPDKEFKTVLGIGSSFGFEFLPIVERIKKLFIVESSKVLRSKDLNGLIPVYKSPSIDGTIDFVDNKFELITCFGVLHHIPNVSHLINEIYRKLTSGGICLIREPINSMGDWNKSRPNLTKRERGIPHVLFKEIIINTGFEIVKESYCLTASSFLQRSLRLILKRPIYSYNFYLWIDFILSKIFEHNIHYHPVMKYQRIAPQSVFYVLKKI